MNARELWNSCRGFTLQEMLVVMIVSSLLFIFVYSAVLFSMRFYGGWQRKNALMRETGHIQRLLADELMKSKHCSIAADSSLHLLGENGTEADYRFERNAVTRNGMPIGPPDIALSVFISIGRDSAMKQYACLSVTGALNGQRYLTPQLALILPSSSVGLFEDGLEDLRSK